MHIYKKKSVTKGDVKPTGTVPMPMFSLAFPLKRKVVEVVVKIGDAAGIFMKIFSMLARHGVKVLGVNFVQENSKGRLFILLDLENTTLTHVSLKYELSRILGIEEITIKRHEPLFKHSKVIYPLIAPYRTSKVAVLELTPLSKAISELRRKFGAGGEVLLYHLGHSLGKCFSEGIKEKQSLDDIVETLNLIQPLGWGRVIDIRVNAPTQSGYIKIDDLFESSSAKGSSNEPKCHLFRGFVAGLISSLTGKEYTVKEVKCVAKGDEYCQFTFKPTM